MGQWQAVYAELAPSTITREHVEKVEGLGNTKLLKRITQWLDCTQEPVTFLGSGLAGVSDRLLRFSQNFQYTYHNQ